MAVCSDIHANIWRLAEALPGINEADLLLVSGDFYTTFTLNQLATGFTGLIHAVLDNNDGDLWLLSRVATQAGNVTLYCALIELELDGFRVAVSHYPSIANGLARSRVYSLVCYGHDQPLRHEQLGKTWLVNSGDMMGRIGRSTNIISDTEQKQLAIREP